MRSYCRVCLSLVAFVQIAGCAQLPAPPPPPPAPVKSPEAVRTNPWVLIDSRTKTLTVYRDSKPEAVFDHVAFGAAGVKQKTRRGDDVTPKGLYTVGWITAQSKFAHFIGLNYPSLEDAQRGFRSGVINRDAFDRIRKALAAGMTPPQDTALGGLIGIHGVGRGSLEIHRIANWTAGCIAIENHQIHRLASMLHPGVQVEIR